MKIITVRRLDLQFDAGQITHGKSAQQVDQAIQLINLTLQREPFGLGAQLFVHRDEIEIETSKEHRFSPTTNLCIHCGVSAEDDLLENQPCKL